MTADQVKLLGVLANLKAQSSDNHARELDARAGVGSFLGAAGKGLLTGGALAGLEAFLSNLAGGSSE